MTPVSDKLYYILNKVAWSVYKPVASKGEATWLIGSTNKPIRFFGGWPNRVPPLSIDIKHIIITKYHSSQIDSPPMTNMKLCIMGEIRIQFNCPIPSPPPPPPVNVVEDPFYRIGQCINNFVDKVKKLIR